MKLMKNIGKTDSIIRAIVGGIIIVLGISFESWWGLLGLVLVLTAITGFCLAYLPFKFSSRNLEDKTIAKDT